MKTKTFDCVEMKRKGSAFVYEQLKGMTQDEEIAYWEVKTRELRLELQRLTEARKTS